MLKSKTLRILAAVLPVAALAVLAAASSGSGETQAALAEAAGSRMAWWIWPIILLGFTFVIGIIAPLSGVGGGVLFVPLSTAFLPFSVDFIRGAGLIMALTSALSASPYFIRKGMADIRLMAPLVCVSMITSVLGGIAGLWITNAFPSGKYYITIALGAVLLFIFGVMLSSKRVEFPEVRNQDRFSRALGLGGAWAEADGNVVRFRVTRLMPGVFFFSLVGFIAGMFGLGAGWANVPVLNLLMGAPIKAAVATSMTIISVNDAAAAWIYLAKGAVLPLIVVPSVIGISIGARIGAKLAVKAKPAFVKQLVLAIMLVAALLNVYKGLSGLQIL
ncbi:MAG: TSUP family transporter [Thermodesulfovibrionales bacterium]